MCLLAVSYLIDVFPQKKYLIADLIKVPVKNGKDFEAIFMGKMLCVS